MNYKIALSEVEKRVSTQRRNRTFEHINLANMEKALVLQAEYQLGRIHAEITPNVTHATEGDEKEFKAVVKYGEYKNTFTDLDQFLLWALRRVTIAEKYPRAKNFLEKVLDSIDDDYKNQYNRKIV